MKNKKIMGFLIILLSSSIIACATIKTNQEKADGHIAIGRAFIQSEMYTEALKELFAAEELTPNDPTVHYYLGIAYLGKAARDKSMKEFERAISLKPDYSEAYNYIGILYTEKQQWDAAIAAFDLALTNILYETPGATLYNKGGALYRKGDYEKSLNCNIDALRMKDALSLKPFIENNIGLNLLALGDYRQALLHFDAALKLAPNFLEAQYWLALTYVQIKRYDEAMRIVKDLVKMKPDDSIYVSKGNTMLEQIKQGRYEEIKWKPY